MVGEGGGGGGGGGGPHNSQPQITTLKKKLCLKCPQEGVWSDCDLAMSVVFFLHIAKLVDFIGK